MSLKPPTTFFREKRNREQQQVANTPEPQKRIKSPQDIFGDVRETANFVTPKKETPKTIVEKIDLLAEVVPEDNRLWEQLSGIEKSITSLHMDKLDRSEVLRLSEDIEMLRDLVESIEIPEVKYYDNDIVELEGSFNQSVTDINEKHEASLKEINTNMLNSTISFGELKEKVDSLVIPDLEGKQESINEIRELHSKLQEVVDDIPNQKSRFDPSSILESLSALRDSVNDSINLNDTKVNERIDSLPEIRHYEDDLDLLQNFITDVKESIKYYDTDVDELKAGIVDLGKHLGETINKKVKKLSADAKKIEKNLSERVESLPEVKYYDDEIDLIEGKIHNLLNSINSLPEVKYYDDDVKILSEAIDNLNSKIDSIDIPDWTDVIENIKGEVANIADMQKDFDQRWEKAAEDKDPLLDPKNFVTFEDMQKHYRTFLERVQIQLGTVGGGGAVEIMEMDDIEDDFRANPQNYDSYFLQHKYDPETKTSSFTAALNFFAELDDIDLSEALDGNILVWDSSINGLKLVTPQSQGINNDFNPSIDIQDYGQYGS